MQITKGRLSLIFKQQLLAYNKLRVNLFEQIALIRSYNENEQNSF